MSKVNVNMGFYRLYKGAWIFGLEPHKECKLLNSNVLRLLRGGGWFATSMISIAARKHLSGM